MCGLSGVFRWDGKEVDSELLRRMTDRLVHRGPDDSGYYLSPPDASPVRAGLGFRRLSIIDLAGGHQPMSAAEGRHWIVFNGEIYNFPELKEMLEKRGRKFLTRSDTEVILQLYGLYGPACVAHLRGMFAFALWDAEKRSLFLARDRIGKKPLFYARRAGSLLFASEMKALLESPEVARNIRPESVPLYLTYQFIPGPHTIFEGIERLPPGHTLLCDSNGKLHVEQYWRLSRKEKLEGDPREIAGELRRTLKEATKIRLISDVPLGAFLSGGVDSSAVVGMMAEEMKEPVQTFSIGFEESDFSELRYARMTAERFHTDHHEFVVKPDVRELLPRLAWHYDQPFADPSAVPSYYVARETRRHVTVALNGDGGDEDFGGYLRYQAGRIFQTLAKIPRPLRALLAEAARALPGSLQRKHLLRRLARAGSLLGSSPEEFNFNLFCYFDPPALSRLLADPRAVLEPSPYEYFLSLYGESDSEEFLERIFACDAAGYLPDCLLVKMDIASMSNSLEARSPFLDHNLMEFAAKIPARYKVKYNGGKWILKQALRGWLPEAILERRKMGFGIPLSEWFRGALAPFLRETLLSEKAAKRGFFRREEVERLLAEHQSGKKDHGYKLWALLMFEIWQQVYIDRSHRF